MLFVTNKCIAIYYSYSNCITILKTFSYELFCLKIKLEEYVTKVHNHYSYNYCSDVDETANR